MALKAYNMAHDSTVASLKFAGSLADGLVGWTLTPQLHQCMIVVMTRTQVQLPDPLYRRLKEVAASNDWSLAEVIRRAAELYVQRFPSRPSEEFWVFPTVDVGGEFLMDPASLRAEAEAIVLRTSK